MATETPVVNNTTDMTCVNDSMSLLSGSPEVLYTINAINALICFVGLAGNIMVFYVVCRFSAMHTVTNIFILMLSLADIAFLVNIPFLMTTAILETWPFGNIYCKIYYSMTTVNQFASSFFLVTMSADRYVAICLPIQSRRIRTTKMAILVCCIVWALAIVLMYPVFLFAATDSAPDGSVTHCNIFWESDSFHESGNHAFALYCFVLGYAFPVMFMLTFYGLVVQKLRSRQNTHEQQMTTSAVLTLPSNCRRRSRVRRVTVMIFIVIVVYLMCWTPYWASQLFITFSPSAQFNHLLTCPLTPAEIGESQRITYISFILQCLCFANSAVNPILYAILSENFKQSYTRACHRITHDDPDKVIIPRSSSFRPELGSQQQKLSPPFSQSRKIYLNYTIRSPSSQLLSPCTANEISTCITNMTNNHSKSQGSTDEGLGEVTILQGEVMASFQITAWSPLLHTQDPVVTRKTLLTTFEMSADAGPCRSL